MQPLFKVLLLTAVITLVGPNTSHAAEQTEQVPANLASDFKSEEQKSAYAVGLLMARSVITDLKAQQQLGVMLQKEDVLVGLQDGFSGRAKLDEPEMQQVLKTLNQRISQLAAAKRAQEAALQAEQGEQFRQRFSTQQGVIKTESGLLYHLERAGKGDKPKESDTVVVHYKGTLIDGTQFDSSYDRAEPTTFLLNRVIPGWIEGLQQVKKGGKIKLVVPPQLAYGEQGVPGIPANATLIFEVELLDINPAAAQKADKQKAQANVGKDKDKNLAKKAATKTK